MSSSKQTEARKSGLPRKRVVPLWRSRWAFGGLAVLMLGGLAAGGWWLWQDGWVERTAQRLQDRAIALTADMGLVVQEVLVSGRQETAKKQLLKAVGVKRGAPILSLNVEAARRRVESLPWVRSASVERILPDTVYLNVIERHPLALWQHKGKFALIDHEGQVILRRGLDRFRHLLVVVGPDAPGHASGLMEILDSQPELRQQVKAAVRVGGRRWNVRLEGGIDVRLPEQNPAGAWARLADFQRTHQVLARDIEVLDLRLPDRLIVRKPARLKQSIKATGQET